MFPAAILAATSVGLKAVGQVVKHREAVRDSNAANEAALADLRAQLSDLRARGAEEVLAAHQRIADTRKSVVAAKASARAAAADVGGAGISTDLLLGDIERQGGDAVLAEETNLQIRLDQLERHGEGLQAQTRGFINQNRPPDFLNTGLSILRDAVETASVFRASRAQTRSELTS